MTIWQQILAYAKKINWIRVGIWTFFLIIFMVGIRSCSHSATGTSGVGNGIWVFLGSGLIVAAVMTRDKPYLAWSFTVLAGLVFLVLLGKFDSLFSWTVIGLPAFAFVGIWMMTRLDPITSRRMRAFLGFSSGFIILYWLFLFYKGHPIENTGFIGKVFFVDNTAKGIFAIFLAVFLLATWKRSGIAYLISFILFASFLGNNMTNEIFNRFPEKLSVSEKTKGTWEKSWELLLKKIDDALSSTTEEKEKALTSAERRNSPSSKVKKEKLEDSEELNKNLPHENGWTKIIFSSADPWAKTFNVRPGKKYEVLPKNKTLRVMFSKKEDKEYEDFKNSFVVPERITIAALWAEEGVFLVREKPEK